MENVIVEEYNRHIKSLTAIYPIKIKDMTVFNHHIFIEKMDFMVFDQNFAFQLQKALDKIGIRSKVIVDPCLELFFKETNTSEIDITMIAKCINELIESYG